MRRIGIISRACLWLSLALLSWALAHAGLTAIVGAVVLLGGLWHLGRRLGSSRLQVAVISTLVLVMAGGVLGEAPMALILGSLLALLGAWDLASFGDRLVSADAPLPEPGFIRSHTHRLLLALTLGGALAALGLRARVHLHFWHALLLSLVALWSLSRRFCQGSRLQIEAGARVAESRTTRADWFSADGP